MADRDKRLAQAEWQPNADDLRESRGTLEKAVEHARKRIREGKSPYRQDDE